MQWPLEARHDSPLGQPDEMQPAMQVWVTVLQIAAGGLGGVQSLSNWQGSPIVEPASWPNRTGVLPLHALRANAQTTAEARNIGMRALRGIFTPVRLLHSSPSSARSVSVA